MQLQGRICSFSSVLLYIITCHHAQAGPVIRSSRMVREIYPEVEQEIPDSSQSQACIVGSTRYAANTPVPSTQPCLQCTCTGGSVVCTSEECVPQPGCRAVHRPGRCCASYTCECAHAGRVYANGERLPQPMGAECSVCYCRGGHVQCAEVGCYTRGDCEPKYVKGECCPKYDHCPPRDPLSDRIIGTSPPLQSLDPDLLSSWSQTRPENSSTSEEGSGDDDIILGDEPRRVSTPVTFSIKEIESKSNSKRNDDKKIIKVDQSTQTDPEGRPQITIQEVIPPRTEFVPHKAVSVSPINPVTYKNQLPEMLSSTETSNNELVDVESYASEKTEVYDHPPPVLRIGDQLLFIKQGQLVPEKDASTPSPVITLIGAEGLQIGLESGELLEQEIIPVSSQESTSQTVSTVQTSQKSVEFDDSSELSTAVPKIKIISSEETTEVNESLFIDDLSTVEASNEFITINTTEVSTISSSTQEPEQSEYIPEENPYYPPIPEDIMIQGQDEITTDITSESSIKISKKPSVDEISVIPLTPKKIEEKILPEILELRNNNTVTSNKTSPSQEWLKLEEPTRITIPLINENAALPDSLLEMTAPSDLTSNQEDNGSNDITTNTMLPSTELISSTEIYKSDKIVANPQPTEEKSKETMELTEELFESGEFTTITPLHSSLLSSNEDASVEVIQNDSSPIDTSDLVEIVPGFERSTEKAVKHDDEQLKIDEISPKDDVEIINMSGEKLVNDKSTHDEIQKRDVVKKVLKDTFDNPKENIRTDLTEDTTNLSVEISGQNDEQNIVKPNHNLLTRGLNNSKVNITKEKEETSVNTAAVQTSTDKEFEVIQKLSTDTSKLNIQESKETLDTSSLGVLRDFFKTQFRQYHNSKLAD